MDEPTSSYKGLKDNGYVTGSCSTMFPEKLSRVKPIWEMSTSNDACQLDDKDDFPAVGSVRRQFLSYIIQITWVTMHVMNLKFN